MRRVEQTGRYDKGLKRWAWRIDWELYASMIYSLQEADRLLPEFREHALDGRWQGCRSADLDPDLRVVFRRKKNVVQLVALGTHDELYPPESKKPRRKRKRGHWDEYWKWFYGD